MNKREFIDRLVLAGEYSREFAERLYHVEGALPKDIVYSVSTEFIGRNTNEEGFIKFLGGRLLKPENLVMCTAVNMGKYLWIDGLVPQWVNVCVVSKTKKSTVVELLFTDCLMPAEADKLPPDINAEPGNELVPFRIRGPSQESWQKIVYA